jgi:hypothetical protein
MVSEEVLYLLARGAAMGMMRIFIYPAQQGLFRVATESWSGHVDLAASVWSAQ